MKRLLYIKPETVNIPMSVITPIIATSMSIDHQLGKEFGCDKYDDFLGSFDSAKDSKHFDDDDYFRDEDGPQ